MPLNFPSAFIPFPRGDLDRSLPWRFEHQVDRGPDRPAVASLTDRLTYRELDHRANAIAGLLLDRLSSNPGPVGLVLGQNSGLISAILGVLKAGMPYLPLSDRWPPERISEVLEDAGAVLLLGEAATRELAERSASGVCPVLLPDYSTGRAVRPEIVVEADAIASLYFTSGTTGRAKGVADTHRNILHNVLRYTNTLGISQNDRLSLLQGASFSGAMSSMFGALLNGACVCPFDVVAHTPSELAAFLNRERVTIYHSVPTIFRSVLSDGRRFPDVRVIRLEGDQASHHDVELFQRHFDPHTTLVNGLGTTETGLVRQYPVTSRCTVEAGILPVGYPVEDMEVLVLDEVHHPVKPGQSGEIAVRSRFLAIGYWRRPDLTERSFLTDPSDPTNRIYLTGDLGRLRSDGCLEYLGRRDSRVKVRGQTVELADVESELLRVAGVREAAVVAVDSPQGERQLTGYVVADESELNPGRIRRVLETRLPPHAVPSRIMFLAALPQSENRKVDRSALAPLDRARPELEMAYAPPSNALESLLVHVWQSILEIEPVGIRDQFRDLGGDSLRAVQMIDQVEQALGRPVSLAVLLEAGTVEELARSLLAKRTEDLRVPVVRINAEGRRRPFFFLHGDYWSDGLYCLHAARHLPAEQPLVLLPPAGLDGGPIPSSIEEMAIHHLKILRRIQPAGPYRLGGNCNGGLVAFEMARLLERDGEQVERLLMIHASGRTINLLLADRVARGIAASGILKGGGDHPAWRRRLVEFGRAWKKTGTAGRLKLLGRKLLRFPRLVRSPAADDGPGAPPVEARARARASGPDGRREQLRDVYMRVAGEYVPGSYRGKVTIFWPTETRETPEDVIARWSKVAPSIELQELPGDYLTFSTVHVEEFARQLARRLE